MIQKWDSGQRGASQATGRDEAKACHLANNQLFYRHLSPLGFENLFTAENHNRTLNSFRSEQHCFVRSRFDINIC